MKFVSKSGNLNITLKPGLEANRVAGTPAEPGLHMRFTDGMITVNDEKIVELMRSHDGYNSDFCEVAEDGRDPFEITRKDKEPGHIITNLKYGTPDGTMASKQKFNMSPEMTRAVQEMAKSMATEMVKEIAPKLAMDMLKELAASSKATEPSNPIPTTGSTTTNSKLKQPIKKEAEGQQAVLTPTPEITSVVEETTLENKEPSATLNK